MGEVYRATDTVLERPVAIKLLAHRHAENPEVRARFRREALAAARLSGIPHVVTVFDVGEHDEQPYIVMEYLDGGSVYDRLRNGKIVPEQALDWLAEAGIALDRAHAEGVVHRDVKPANLMLDRDGQVVVSDFGIASTTGVDTLTLPGTVLGTAGYLSPEQARGEPATPASDRYGLGVVAFELLAGRRPFQGETAATEAFAHVNAPVPSAERLDPDLPDGVDDVFAHALAKDPDDRPASCGELVAELRQTFRDAEETTRSIAPATPPVVASPAGGSAPPTRTLHASGTGRRRFTIVGVGLLVAGLLFAAVLGAVLVGDDFEPRAQRTTSQPRTQTDTPTETTQKAPTEPTTTETQPPPAPDGEALNDQGFALMQEGAYEEALPVLERAVRALSGTGALVEAWASYNLAFTRVALGSCHGVLPLLDRSEAVQGERKEIDALRRECGEGDDKGNGRGRGKGNGNGNDD